VLEETSCRERRSYRGVGSAVGDGVLTVARMGRCSIVARGHWWTKACEDSASQRRQGLPSTRLWRWWDAWRRRHTAFEARSGSRRDGVARTHCRRALRHAGAPRRVPERLRTTRRRTLPTGDVPQGAGRRGRARVGPSIGTRRRKCLMRARGAGHCGHRWHFVN